MDPNSTLIFICSLVVLSYLFDLFARWLRIPSVLFLIGTGMAIRGLAVSWGFDFESVETMIHLFGAIGLIMIVLESALDLELSREKWRVVARAVIAAQGILFVSTGAVLVLLHPYLGGDIRTSLLYAIPLSVISSAIVLPSVAHLPPAKREFLVYEAGFSDILGILLFNYVASAALFDVDSVVSFSAKVLGLLLLSLGAAFGLMLLLGKIRRRVKIFLVIALLILLYAAGKAVHFPTLVLILLFGLVMNNLHLLPAGLFQRLIDPANMSLALGQLKTITVETSFLVRTFFFVTFGFTMDLGVLNDTAVFRIGFGIVLALLLARFVALRYVLRTPLLPEIFMLPRGLVTVILYYQIPEAFRTPAFNEGILLFVIIATNLLMIGGFSVSPVPVPVEKVEESSY